MAGTIVSINTGTAEATSRATGKRWNLDRFSFDALLRALDPDRDVASNRYTALHERLVRFFQWNNIEDADALADETMDRLARRVAADKAEMNQPMTEAVKEPEKFAAGVARLLLHEYWRQKQRQEQALESMTRQDWAGSAEAKQETEVLAAALDNCLRKLPAVQRDLIERYYGTEGQSQIEARKQLAEQHKISLNALRNRAMRIRVDLEQRAAKALGK